MVTSPPLQRKVWRWWSHNPIPADPISTHPCVSQLTPAWQFGRAMDGLCMSYSCDGEGNFGYSRRHARTHESTGFCRISSRHGSAMRGRRNVCADGRSEVSHPYSFYSNDILRRASCFLASLFSQCSERYLVPSLARKSKQRSRKARQETVLSVPSEQKLE